MCGILGQVNFKAPFSYDLDKFKKALDLQYHRGPDDFDILENSNFIFGHRRLSIMDLDTHAKQPMTSHCKNYTLVFNGEIYNYREIKDKLILKGYIFNTTSDTEVLLNAYIEYGIKCIKMFIGMFAFVINDKITNTTYVVRDRLGIKPLYYYFNEEKFLFSSEIKSIFCIEDKLEKKLNTNAIVSYMSFRYPILNDTYFEEVHSLAPGHYLKISSAKLENVEYWNPSFKFKAQSNDKGEEYYIDTLRKLLKSSVEYRMISDVPIGAFLSGGVDSSVITALMSNKSKEPIKTFTIGFEEKGFNEFEYANLIANKYSTKHKEICVSGDNYIDVMEKLIEYKDAPLSVPNEVPLYLMSKELKKDVTVVLSGEGADEIFGGYGRIFRSPYDYERIKKIDNLELNNNEKRELSINFFKKYLQKSFDSELEHFINIYSYTSFNDKQDLLHSDINLDRIEKKLIDKFLYYFDELEDDSYYNKMMYTFEKIHLVGLLHRVDMTTMAASVEARVPFVDHRLVEFAFTIPIKYKLKWNNEKDKSFKTLMSDKISEEYDTPKYILKKSYEDLIPNEVLYRKKMGFPVPLNNWFGGNFNEYAKTILLSDIAKTRNLYNIENIIKWLDSDRLSSDHGFAMKIWMLINIELFMKQNFN